MIRSGGAREISFYDRAIETLDRESLGELQSEKLRALIGRIKANEFYRQKAATAELELERISSIEQLHDFPFTTKAELAQDQTDHPPFGRWRTYPLAQYRYFHQTSGTTGRPLKLLDTAEDWDWWSRCWAQVYRAAGVTESDIVFCAFSFGPYISHWASIAGAWHTGALAISGGGMRTEQRLQTILENNCTVLVCTPTYALHLAEVAKNSGFDISSSSIRVGIHAGEPGASQPNIKSAIEQAWGETCFDHAGATEAGAWAFECEAQCGAIHLNESEFVFDVIDPHTLEPVSEGARGELVVTNLGRTGMPVLRYRTGDLVELTREPCPCGRSFVRIKGGVLGRTDDMLIVRGVNLYPSAIDNLIRGLGFVVEYEVLIRRVSSMDDLLVRMEIAERTQAETARVSLEHAFRRQMGIRVAVEIAPSGSLPRYEFKARRYKRIDE